MLQLEQRNHPRSIVWEFGRKSPYNQSSSAPDLPQYIYLATVVLCLSISTANPIPLFGNLNPRFRQAGYLTNRLRQHLCFFPHAPFLSVSTPIVRCTSRMSTDWQTKAQAYKDSVNAQIKPEWQLPLSLLPLPYNVKDLTVTSGLLTPKQLEIVALDATALRDAILNKTYTSVEVAQAYCIAAAVVHQATNSLMEFFPDEALERARWLDAEYERTGKPVGAMHGVPVSVKGEDPACTWE